MLTSDFHLAFDNGSMVSLRTPLKTVTVVLIQGMANILVSLIGLILLTFFMLKMEKKTRN